MYTVTVTVRGGEKAFRTSLDAKTHRDQHVPKRKKKERKRIGSNCSTHSAKLDQRRFSR